MHNLKDAIKEIQRVREHERLEMLTREKEELWDWIRMQIGFNKEIISAIKRVIELSK